MTGGIGERTGGTRDGFRPLLERARRRAAATLGSRNVRLWALHIVAFTAAYTLAYLARFDFSLKGHVPGYLGSLPLVVAVQMAVAVRLELFRSCWRYVSLNDMAAI